VLCPEAFIIPSWWSATSKPACASTGDGIGLDLLQDRHVEADWPDLFDAPSRRVRAVFLGDAAVPDDHAGVLELNVFDGDIPTGPPPSPRQGRRPRRRGLGSSCCRFVDIEAVLSRLAALGLGGPPRRPTQSTPRGLITLATVRDPDGLLVLLTPRFDYQARVTS